MERLKKRCLVLSFSGHVFLLSLVLVSPLLLPKPPLTVTAPLLNYIPAEIVESVIGTGGKPGGGTKAGGVGSPAPGTRVDPPVPQKSSAVPLVGPVEPIQEPATPPKPKEAEPPPKPSKPKKTVVEPEAEVVPEPKITQKAVVPDLAAKSKRKAPKKPDTEVVESADTPAKAKPSKPAIQPNLTMKRSSSESADRERERASKARAEAAAAAAAAEAAAAAKRAGEARGAMINGMAAKLGSGLSSGLSIEGVGGIGEGIGGDGTASYGQVIMSIYQRAWIEPADADNAQNVVRTEVNIARDGSVISARVIAPCRNESVNKTVRRALEKVKFIAPFPASMKDASKVFYIDFDLQAKRQLG